MDKLFTDAIEKITELIAVTSALKELYGEATPDAAKLANKQAEKKALSAEVQAMLVNINKELGAPAAAAPDAAAEAAEEAKAAAEKEAEDAAVIGGGLKRAKKAAGKSKRAQKGGADEAVAPSSVVSPAVYNIQGMLTQTHNP